mmetsp:Transcript_32591/g.77171  ORF Transcript_32591/g.77171 Transcript_32591/m.77171 type:complete len:162 (+) Transcript_32591:814-1299(+)
MSPSAGTPHANTPGEAPPAHISDLQNISSGFSEVPAFSAAAVRAGSTAGGRPVTRVLDLQMSDDTPSSSPPKSYERGAHVSPLITPISPEPNRAVLDGFLGEERKGSSELLEGFSPCSPAHPSPQATVPRGAASTAASLGGSGGSGGGGGGETPPPPAGGG